MMKPLYRANGELARAKEYIDPKVDGGCIDREQVDSVLVAGNVSDGARSRG